MENIIKAITSNNLYLAIAIILGVIVVFSIIKKLVKLVLISVLFIVLYLFYLSYTGKNIPKSRQEIIDHISEKIKKGTMEGRKLLEENMKNMKSKGIK